MSSYMTPILRCSHWFKINDNNERIELSYIGSSQLANLLGTPVAPSVAGGCVIHCRLLILSLIYVDRYFVYACLLIHCVMSVIVIKKLLTYTIRSLFSL